MHNLYVWSRKQEINIDTMYRLCVFVSRGGGGGGGGIGGVEEK